MGLKYSFSAAITKSTKELEQIILKSQIYQKTAGILRLKNDKQRMTLSSIILVFTKASMIDRDFNEQERQEVIKRIQRFLNLGEDETYALILETKKELQGLSGRNPDFIAAPFAYLGKVANDKTKDKLFRYLTNIVAADKKVEEEEEYLLELAGMAFGLPEKTIREYLLATELMTDLEEIQKKDEWSDSFSSGSSTEAPVIRFELQ